jgi:hypothetical protein
MRIRIERAAMRRESVIGALFLSVMCAALDQVAGAAANPVARCNGIADHFSDDPTTWLRAGRIVGDTRAYLRWQVGDECAREPINDCLTPTRSYLVPGDLVAVAGSVPGFVCVSYAKSARQKRNIFGWLAEEQVKVESPTAEARSSDDWVGTWHASAATLSISAAGPSLHVSGHAAWQKLAAPHFGDLDYSAIPVGDTLTLDAGGGTGTCKVQLLRLGELLVATDNQNCGAPNVSFTGFYAR